MGDACSFEFPSLIPPPQKRASAFSWGLLLVLCLGVLGQGERSVVDPRFASPGATLWTYWGALRANDAEAAAECLEEGGYTGPYPGTLWFLPPTRELRLEAMHALPVQRCRVMVSYEVHYFPLGVNEDMSFRTETQLVQVRGEWRISPAPGGNASLPEWKPTYRPTSI